MIKKSLLAAAIAVATLGGALSASATTGIFSDAQTQAASNRVEIGSFNAPGVGVVEIHDYRLGAMGDLLGTTDVMNGANADVFVELNAKPQGNVIAVLKVQGEVVGMEMIRITDES